MILFEAGPICLAAVADLDGEPGIVGDGTGDEDGDGFLDLAEACELMIDPCVFDTDLDSDGLPDAADNCPFIPNPGQADGDADGAGKSLRGRRDQTLDHVTLTELQSIANIYREYFCNQLQITSGMSPLDFTGSILYCEAASNPAVGGIRFQAVSGTTVVVPRP